MADHGFSFPLYGTFEGSPMRTVGSLGGIGRALPLEEAQALGYHGRMSFVLDDPEVHYLEMLSPGRRQAYGEALEPAASARTTVRFPDGAEADGAIEGCIAQGRIAVYGSVENALLLYYFPQQVNRFSELALTSPRVMAALDRYSECMNEHGYDVAAPSDALRLARRKFHGSLTTGRDELAQAAADARCQKSSGVFRTARQVLLSEAEQWLVTHHDELLELARIRNDALERALTILDIHR